jgi:hypothetical protein
VQDEKYGTALKNQIVIENLCRNETKMGQTILS